MNIFGLNVLPEGEAVLNIENGVLKVENRKFRYSAPKVELNGKKNYTAKYLIKSKSEAIHLSAYFKVIYMLGSKEYTSYICGEKTKVTPEEYTLLKGSLNLWKELEVKEVISYIVQENNEILDDYFIASYKIEEEEQKNDTKEIFTFAEKCPVGAIRWDAYFSVENEKSNVSREVSKTLSPDIFHSHAPFFAKTVGRDKVIFGEATQEQFDKECELAVDAGIDYFAYCWYRNNDPMCYARRQHTQSIYRDKIKMCAIIGVSRLDEESIDELASTCKEDFYLKIFDRPVIYVFGAMNLSREYINFIREHVSEKAENPYFIAMGGSNALHAYDLKTRGYNAITSYSCFPNGEGWSYQELLEKADERNELLKNLTAFIDYVPHITCGLDFRPRVMNPVSWMGGKNFAYTGTSEEIYLHAKKTLKKAKNVPAVLIYAWNEHDEGGWCCPTLTVDENGNTVTDENGNNVMDRSHLDGIKKAIGEYKNGILK